MQNASHKEDFLSGGRLKISRTSCKEAASDSNENVHFVLQACTNYVLSTRSEEFMEKYKVMIRAFKTVSNNPISGILPRIGAAGVFYNNAFSTINRLASLSSQKEIVFVNMWDDFYYVRPDSRQRFAPERGWFSAIRKAFK